MENKLVEILNEAQGTSYATLEEARKFYSSEEILDAWLCYEGIIGFTSSIVSICKILEI